MKTAVRLLVAVSLGILVAMLAYQTTLAYVTLYHWSSNSTTYSFDISLPTAFRTPVDNGAASWTNVTTSSWSYSRVAFSGHPIKYGAWDGPGDDLAVTTLIIEAGTTTILDFEILFDNEEPWSNAPTSSQYDRQSAAVHEFGHALGLGHTNVSCTGTSRPTMCSQIPLGTTYMRSLQQDDRDGVSAIYP